MINHTPLRNAYWHLLFWHILTTCLPYNSHGQQRTNALLNSNPATITLESGTFISYGYADLEQVQLKTLPPNTNGWVEFQFSNLTNSSDITVNLEDFTNASNFFTFTFSNEEVRAINYLEPTKNVTLPRSGIARNDVLFRLERCTNSVAWYIDDQLVYQAITKNNDAELQTKMQVTTTVDVRLTTVFEEGEARCPSCSELTGSTLRAGDLMFLGFDNDVNLGADRVVITNLVELASGTNFTLAEAAYNDQDKKWYASDGRNDEQIGSLSITYVGSDPIPTNSIICFDLRAVAAAESPMAENFMVNGLMMEDFCVVNNGFSHLYSVDLSTSSQWSIFLMQGEWKFTNDYGLWCGTVVSGLHFGGNWTPNNNTPNTAARESNLPPDIVCLPQFDNNGNTGGSAFYYSDYNTLSTSKQTALSDLTNMGNFTDSNGLPNDICDVNIEPLIAADQPTPEHWFEVGNLSVQAYPNPFLQDIFLRFATEVATPVQIRLLDATGKVLRTENINLSAGESKHPLYLTNNLSAGLYFLQVQTTTDTRSIKLVKTAIEQLNDF